MRTDLLLVFSLQVQSGLDVASRLLKGLSLRDLCWVVGADPNDVGAQEDQHVCTQLRGEKKKKDIQCLSSDQLNLSTKPALAQHSGIPGHLSSLGALLNCSMGKKANL